MNILIVDDAPDIQRLLALYLKVAGYPSVQMMGSACEAVEQLQATVAAGDALHTDLILMDVSMQGMDGIEACRALKADERLQDIPVIMVTGKTEAEDLQRAFDAGAMDYITKPINRVELLARVRSALKLKSEMDHRKSREEELLKVTQQLEAANAKLVQMVVSDGLTGLANRRRFDEVLGAEWRRCAREQVPISLIMLDVDHFKAYNDTYGHQAGDECLIQVAGALSDVTRRPADLAARYGGEEFALVLPHTDTIGAHHVAEAARTGVERLQIPHLASPVRDWVTISGGVATIVPDVGAPLKDFVEATDQALYRAKHGRRNQIEGIVLSH